MEQGRVLIAIALSFAVFFVWNFFFVEKPEVVQQQPPAVEETVAETQSESAPASSTMASAKSDDAFVAPEKDGSKDLAAARILTVKTPLYVVRISENGAVFKSFELENYREQADKNSARKNLLDPEYNGQNMKVSLAGGGPAGLDTAVFEADDSSDTILVTDMERTLSFTWQSESGVVVEKQFTFSPVSYLIGLELAFKNGSDGGFTDRAAVEIQHAVPKTRGYAFEGPSALLNDKLEQVKIKKIEDNNRLTGSFKWMAIEDRYFMRSLIPVEPVDGVVALAVEDKEVVVCQLQRPERTFLPGETVTYGYKVFFGPKSMALLNSLGYDLGKAVQFGMFSFIAKPLLWFMNFIYSIIPNFGVAIIILTICTKIVLWPLGNKSYKSMSEMKKIQPLMAEVREKHKNDKKQMNQELMALYKTYKINPMGGCLPMVLQIPVFFALYRMLYSAIELRHTPFVLWITDLSAPDRLFEFGFSIPFMEPPYGIPVLTLVMGATMFLQQKMSPPPGDPTQAKMMMIMPIVFTFIFINFSSGLVLYWLVNNVLSISQQYYIQKKYA